MEVNRQNYESYLLDYIEGNLPENLVPVVLTFLKKNPDIEEETKSLFEFTVSTDSEKFNHKSALKKNIHSDIPGISKFEQLSIAQLENEITENESQQLEFLLKENKYLRNQHQLIQKTRLYPDLSVVYKDKQHILRPVNNKLFIPSSLFYIAASIILLIGLGILFYQPTDMGYAKRIAYKSYNYPERNVTKIYEQNFPDKSEKIVLETKKTLTDTILIRDLSEEQLIRSVKLKQLPVSLKSNIESIMIKNSEIILQHLAVNQEYTPLQTYLKHQFNEKVLKQDKNDKFTVISFVNAFGRFTNKVFHKKLEVEKIKKDNGELLYAIRTDNFDLYTKRKNNSTESDKNKSPEYEKRKE